ncbi:hypothetical protein [Blastopirellula marina]|uniref:Uncharacterized protein n=1 Tax=Blastopirellula marina TaxID=124 RepID=A0A2S8GLB8_9BACT|nr:hypothetical protein [Blastopirellula marina]PQO45233.1 hypothetical protein C5Y93_14820 [Blastopirellula marina]
MNSDPWENSQRESSQRSPSPQASFPRATIAHRRLSYLTMGLGIVLANLGALLLISPGALAVSMFPLSMAAVMIVGQYIGLNRGFPDLLELVNFVLMVILVLCLILTLAFPPILIVLAITVPTHLKNREFNRQVQAAQREGIARPRFAKLTLAEILWVFLVLALILGPASMISRMERSQRDRHWESQRKPASQTSVRASYLHAVQTVA